MSLPLSPASIAMAEAERLLEDACLPLAEIVRGFPDGVGLRQAMLMLKYQNKEPALLQEAIDAYKVASLGLPLMKAGAFAVVRDMLNTWFRNTGDDAARLLVLEALRRGLITASGLRGTSHPDLPPDLFEIGTVDLEQESLRGDGGPWRCVTLYPGQEEMPVRVARAPSTEDKQVEFRNFLHNACLMGRVKGRDYRMCGDRRDSGGRVVVEVHVLLSKEKIWATIEAAYASVGKEPPMTSATFKQFMKAGSKHWARLPVRGKLFVFVNKGRRFSS